MFIIHSHFAPKINRIFAAAILLLFSCNADHKKDGKEKTEETSVPTRTVFEYGVASGDPSKNSVIIWTKISPYGRELVNGSWKICSDAEMKNTVLEGEFETNQDWDHVVKIRAGNLEPGKYYYYQFEALDQKSIVGRTKTLPENTEKIRLGFASCSNFSSGYFNAYHLMADDSLDAVIHLGDYIYEYGEDPEIENPLGRGPQPKHEIVSLDDYRRRYAQYRKDPDLQYLHAKHPFISVYDDHELANNAYEDGAQNHDVSEGDWKMRLSDAKRAYYEWMPIEENEGRHYRSFSFGKLAKLIMVDTRTDKRTKQPLVADKNNADTSAHIISKGQMNWLMTELLSESEWKIIGNQILFSDIKVFFSKSGQLYNDGWSAYRKDHDLVAEVIREKGANIVFVTGDFHSSFVIGGENYTEFVVPSITSANYDEDYGKDSAGVYKRWYKDANPEISFIDLTEHGYLTLEITPEKCIASFFLLTNIKEFDNRTHYSITRRIENSHQKPLNFK